jgi:hypothetical protein
LALRPRFAIPFVPQPERSLYRKPLDSRYFKDALLLEMAGFLSGFDLFTNTEKWKK